MIDNVMTDFFFYNFATRLILYISYLVLFYYVVICIVNAKQLVLALSSIPSYMKKAKFMDVRTYSQSTNVPPFSILVPAYNEEKTIIESIKSLLDLNYSVYEIIIINDGSTDATLEIVKNVFKLKPVNYPLRPKLSTEEVLEVYSNPDFPLLLVDKKNGGKADALNAGINISQYPYFVSIDADSLLDPDALTRLALAFLEYKYTIAVGGVVRVVNGSIVKDGKIVEPSVPAKSIERFQAVEYLRAFLIGRTGWGYFNLLLIVSGAFGAFQKGTVIEVGGYTTDTVGEDMELVLKLHKHMREKKYEYKISFLPDPVCWTQAPTTVRELVNQRSRWQVGLIDSLNRNREMAFNRKYGYLGMVSMPYYILCEMMGPIVEIVGIISIPLAYYFGILSFEFLMVYILLSVVFGVIISMGSLMLEEYTLNKYPKLSDIIVLGIYSVLENFSYRPFTMLIRLNAILFYRKYKHSWGKAKRKRFM